MGNLESGRIYLQMTNFQYTNIKRTHATQYKKKNSEKIVKEPTRNKTKEKRWMTNRYMKT